MRVMKNKPEGSQRRREEMSAGARDPRSVGVLHMFDSRGPSEKDYIERPAPFPQLYCVKCVV